MKSARIAQAKDPGSAMETRKFLHTTFGQLVCDFDRDEIARAQIMDQRAHVRKKLRF